MEGQNRFFTFSIASVLAVSSLFVVSTQASVSVSAPQFQEVLYTAKIQWNGAGSEPLHFKLGKMKHVVAGQSRIAAVITGSGNETQAVCERMLSTGRSQGYDQVTMLCNGPLFPTPAITTFSFPNSMKHPKLTALIGNKSKVVELAD